MSQQSSSSSSKNMSDSSSSESCNPNREDPVADSANTSHARRPKETVSGFSSAIALDEQTREGSRYVHNAIATMVTGILSGNHKVLGVSIPLNTIVPDNVAYQENTISLGKNVYADAEQTDAHKGSNIDKPLDNVGGEEVRVTHDVSDNPNCEAEIVDLEEFSDNELLSSVVPSIAKRVRTRREQKTVAQRSPRKKIDVPTSPNPKVVESSLKRKGHGPTKTWSKGVPKKNKTKSVVVESDSDVPCDVPDTLSKKKPTTSKLAASVSEVPIDNISFHFASSVNRWKYVYQKRLALERELAQNVLECKEIMDLIQEAGLMKTVTQFSKCYEMLVKEFIVNVSEECVDGKSKEFRKVYVRGKCLHFSPSVINMYLGRPDVAQLELEVTDNKICQVITTNQVRKWPLKGKLVASKLSVKYAMLHKIGVANWVPTNHKSTVVVMLGKFIYVVGTKANFDYGSYIFYQTLKHAGSFSVKGPIAFPSLICGIVLNQFPNILTENDSVKRRDSPLSFNHKLFLGTHVPDVAMATSETSSVCNQPGKADVIAMLKETCKELEARKLNLEKLIIKLEMTEGDVLGEAVAAAEGDERQGEEGEADASPEDGTDDDADSESDN
ncbi:uncharacterized protein LOC127123663 [Lathyrus oleraceus]|uniref:uncharacterized protein LOC127123663 n=1 Tax=Pisum sativum TaxID=3888 RepID=UPI0021CEAE76|nr:uncharacterized protein LOC127123663 [Pisum sativum]